MNDSEVQVLTDALCRLLTVRDVRLERLTMGMSSSRTYLIDTGTDRFVAKVSDDPAALSMSEHNLKRLAKLDIPVPRVVAYDGSLSTIPVALLVMTRLGGRDLHYELDQMSRSQMTRLAEQITEFQRRVATLPALGKGCGFAGIDMPVERSWSDVVHHPNGHVYADPMPGDVAPLLGRLQRSLDSVESYFNSVTPTCFLDDLTTKNVLIKNGELSGVVDFDHVAYGDPLFHLGLTGAAVRANSSPAAWFYIHELIRLAGLSEEQRKIRDLYEAVFLVNFLGAEWAHRQGPWRAVACASADALLD